jgi:hypothetical protein
MRILVACERSGEVRRALREAGHFAFSCDLVPAEDGEVSQHYQGDIFDLTGYPWDAMIAFAPCTYLCNSGVRWLYNEDGTKNMDRWEKMEAGALFFKKLWNLPIPCIAMENPIMHKYAREIIFSDTTFDYNKQMIQPWQFGHAEKKGTCLWLKGLLPLKGTDNVYKEMKALPVREQQRIHHMSPGPCRSIERARTFTGIARAMASQWF